MNETNARGVRRRSVETVVPVYNEAHVLADSIGRRHAHLEASFPCPYPFPFPFGITPADDADVRRRSTSHVVRGPEHESVSRSSNAPRIHEMPVDRVDDDPGSRVDIVGSAMDDLTGVRRMHTSSPAPSLEYAS
jgi:hypothetical protein